MEFRDKSSCADIIVVGAGVPGICAAIQAARRGLSVALINDRGVLGGNASAEIGISVEGAADGGDLNLNSREGGICSEILLEYKHRSPIKRSRYVFDGVLIDFVNREPNIKVFLNTCIDDAQMSGNQIVSVGGTQNTTETRWTFKGKYFVDNTGDGTLGALAGAEYMLGREGKNAFGESIAPDQPDKYVIPSTLTFHAFDAGYPVSYVAPDFAFDIPASGALERRVIPHHLFHNFQWFYEIGGEYDHVFEREEIIRDHKKLAFGIWDYIKNSGKYPEAENYDIEYMACIPGTREYRRLVGDYILTENDIIDQPDHDDTIGHGGWSIDLHALKGFFDQDLINRHIHFPGPYKIPYRTGYSKNILNLFMCGRCMSTSHVAFGSTRVIATLSTLGQAVGMAASLCKKYDVLPRDIYKNHVKELQQELLKEDQLIIGCKNVDENDMARQAKVSASSTQCLGMTHQKQFDCEAHIRTIAPENKDAVRKAVDDFTDYKTLDCALALSIPVNERLERVSVLLNVRQDTTLRYRVFLPRVKENYGPDVLVSENKIDLKKTDNFQWFDISVGLKIGEMYALIELLENESIEVAISSQSLPNTMMFRSYINTATNIVSYKTKDMAERVLRRSPVSMCYKTHPEQIAYSPNYVINGYNRAYGISNMWLSAKNDALPELRLRWAGAINIREIHINFAVDTTKKLYWEVNNGDTVMDLIAVEYSVYAVVDGQEVCICDIKDNYKKANKLMVDNIETNEIILKFHKSNTGQIGVYEVRVY